MAMPEEEGQLIFDGFDPTKKRPKKPPRRQVLIWLGLGGVAALTSYDIGDKLITTESADQGHVNKDTILNACLNASQALSFYAGSMRSNHLVNQIEVDNLPAEVPITDEYLNIAQTQPRELAFLEIYKEITSAYKTQRPNKIDIMNAALSAYTLTRGSISQGIYNDNRLLQIKINLDVIDPVINAANDSTLNNERLWNILSFGFGIVDPSAQPTNISKDADPGAQIYSQIGSILSRGL